MNKKAVETTLIMTAFKILIGAVIAIVLVSLIFKFISPNGAKDEENIYFYFTKLGEDLTKMSIGDVKDSNFLTNKGFTLLAFNKDRDTIKKTDLGDSCVEYNLEDISKPIKCRDKNCICLCKSDLSLDFVAFLIVDCGSEESRCIELSSKVNSPNACKSFFLYNREEKLYNLNLKKESDSYSIKIDASKTL